MNNVTLSINMKFIQGKGTIIGLLTRTKCGLGNKVQDDTI